MRLFNKLKQAAIILGSRVTPTFKASSITKGNKLADAILVKIGPLKPAANK